MLTLGQLKVNFPGALNCIFAAVMARFAVSAANFVYAPQQKKGKNEEMRRWNQKSPYLCIVKTAIERAMSRKKFRAIPSGSGFERSLNHKRKDAI
jgi:hypothetical protein